MKGRSGKRDPMARRGGAESAPVVRLSQLIAPSFYALHWDIAEGRHTYYDLYGGRGSGKSSFISVEIVLGIMSDPAANAVVFRKVGNTIGTSVYEQILWAIDALGVSGRWQCGVSPYRATYVPTGQAILFRGLDSARKLKSVKVSKGYLKYLWFEELDEFDGPEEVRSVQQSVLRGGDRFVVFKSFNPPVSRSNWVNTYVTQPARDTLRHRSSYLEMPRRWLGKAFFDAAEELERSNARAYRHEYLGEVTGTGGEVFENLELRPISDAELERFDNLLMGIDWGWYPDPFQWVKLHYDAGRQALYVIDEYRAYRQKNSDAWQALKEQKGVRECDLIIADSAEEKSIQDFRSYGSLCRAAVKGPDSRRYSFKWLQSLRKIVIDPARCPHAAREFSQYEYARTPSGEPLNGYPDGDDHAIDAARYATERIWRRRGA